MDVNDLKMKVESYELTPFDKEDSLHVFARSVAMTAFENPDESSLMGFISTNKPSDSIMERLGKLAFSGLMEEDLDARSFLLFSCFSSPSRATLLSKYIHQLVAKQGLDWYEAMSFLLCTKFSQKQDTIKLIKRLLTKNPMLVTKLTKFM